MCKRLSSQCGSGLWWCLAWSSHLVGHYTSSVRNSSQYVLPLFSNPARHYGGILVQTQNQKKNTCTPFQKTQNQKENVHTISKNTKPKEKRAHHFKKHKTIFRLHVQHFSKWFYVFWNGVRVFPQSHAHHFESTQWPQRQWRNMSMVLQRDHLPTRRKRYGMIFLP